MDADLEQKVLSADTRITCRPGELLEPAFEKLKAEIGDLARSDEDVLTYAMFPAIAADFLKEKYNL